MPVIDFQIRSREQYAEGRAFGEVGAYDRIEGRLRYAVDPEADANRGIVDLQRAPRDAAGRVHFEGDVRLLVPADPARGNGTLLVDVPNRGNTLATSLFNRAQREERLINPDPAGDGFLFERGFSIAAVGWQWDVPDLPPMLRFRAPEALDDSGRPLRGSVIAEIRPSAAAREWTLAQGLHRAYPAADLDEASARLIMREFEDGPDVVIPRDRWRFATLAPEGERPSRDHVLLEDEFAPGKIYYLVYSTEGAPRGGNGPAGLSRCGGVLPISNCGHAGISTRHWLRAIPKRSLFAAPDLAGAEPERGRRGGVRRAAGGRGRRDTGGV